MINIDLVGGLVAIFSFPIYRESPSQLTNSYFSEGWKKTTNQKHMVNIDQTMLKTYDFGYNHQDITIWI